VNSLDDDIHPVADPDAPKQSIRLYQNQRIEFGMHQEK
jgi:hypothetical protein